MWRGLGVVGVGLLLDDTDDLFDGEIGLGIAETNAGDVDMAHGAIEVGGEDLDPLLRCGSVAVSLRLRAEFDEVVVGGWREE